MKNETSSKLKTARNFFFGNGAMEHFDNAQKDPQSKNKELAKGVGKALLPIASALSIGLILGLAVLSGPMAPLIATVCGLTGFAAVRKSVKGISMNSQERHNARVREGTKQLSGRKKEIEAVEAQKQEKQTKGKKLGKISLLSGIIGIIALAIATALTGPIVPILGLLGGAALLTSTVSGVKSGVNYLDAHKKGKDIDKILERSLTQEEKKELSTMNTIKPDDIEKLGKVDKIKFEFPESSSLGTEQKNKIKEKLNTLSADELQTQFSITKENGVYKIPEEKLDDIKALVNKDIKIKFDDGVVNEQERKEMKKEIRANFDIIPNDIKEKLKANNPLTQEDMNKSKKALEEKKAGRQR